LWEILAVALPLGLAAFGVIMFFYCGMRDNNKGEYDDI
jgi:hypothetical protein